MQRAFQKLLAVGPLSLTMCCSAFRMFPAGLACAVALLLPVAQADEPQWNGLPVVGFARVAPLQHVQRDLSFLLDSVDGGESQTAVRDLFAAVAQAVDPSRPGGMVIYIDETLVPVIFLPLRDEEQVFVLLKAQFGWEFYRGDDGFYRGGNVNAVARVANSWLYFTGPRHRERLLNVPDDPAAVFQEADPTVTAQLAVFMDRIPAELQAELGAAFVEGYGPAEPGTAEGVTLSLLAHLAEHVSTDASAITAELQCFRPLNQFHLSARLTAEQDSPLAGWIDEAAQRPAVFEHLASDNAFVALLAAVSLSEETSQKLLELWQPVAAAARAAAPSPKSGDEPSRMLGRLVLNALDSVTATLQGGELAGGLVLERAPQKHYAVLSGVTLQGSRDVEEAAIEVGQLLQQTAEFQALQWAVSNNGDVSLHQMEFPVDDAGVQKLFGSPLRAAVGVGEQRVYAALGGEDVLSELSLAVDRSREEPAETGELLRLMLRMAPTLTFLDLVPGSNPETDRNIHEMATRIGPYRRNDTLELTVRAAASAVEGRLRVDMGVLRMLAAELPATPERTTDSRPKPGTAPRPPATADGTLRPLRLRKGERFELLFHNAADVTVTIDGNARPETSADALLYDFEVLEVTSDGLMRVQTRLRHVTMDRTTPEGQTSFDSASPPPMDEMTPAMLLHSLLIDRPFVLLLQPDGVIAEVEGLEEQIADVVDNQLEPPASERQQAVDFVRQVFNANGLRDSLARGFEFYPSQPVRAGQRWTRTTENYSGIPFLLDHRFQLKSASGDAIVMSARSQIREKDPADAGDQSVRWEVVGSQTANIIVDAANGRLGLAEYVLQTDAEAFLMMDGQEVSRPLEATFRMTVGDPARVREKIDTVAP